MKYSLFLFLFISIGMYGQKSANNSIVSVTLNASAETQNQNIAELNEKLLQSLSELSALKSLDFSKNKGIENLELVMMFKDMQSFLSWYGTDETKQLILQIEQNYKESSLKIKFVKNVNIN